MEDHRRLVESGLNTMMMVAFAVPGGQPVGVLAVIGSFFFSTLYPGPPPLLPKDQPVTKGELDAVLAKLKADLIKAGFQAGCDAITNNLLDDNEAFTKQWTSIQTYKMGTDRQYDTDTSDYFDLHKSSDYPGLLYRLRGYRNSLTLSSLNDGSLSALEVAEKRTAHTGLYCFAGSLLVAFLKAAVAWNWGKARWVAMQWQERQSEIDNWNDQVQKVPNYANVHPYADLITGLKLKYPDAPGDLTYVPATWNSWLTSEYCAHDFLVNEVQKLLDYCVTVPADGSGAPAADGLCTQMRKELDAFDAQVTSYDVPLAPNQGISKAQMKAAIEKGADRAGAWEPTLSRIAFYGVTEDDIAAFEKTIGAWRAAAASVTFSTYTVKKGDTLASIAKANYKGDATQAQQIFDNNRDQLSDPAALLTEGLILKIYHKEVLPYLDL
jgi:hypothetical protein